MLRLSDFDYDLPGDLIAQYPLKARAQARLLVLNRREESIEHLTFKDLTGYLRKGDILVLNNTRVLPSRLIARRLTEGKVELLLLRRKTGLTFHALIKPARLKINEKIIFNGGKISAVITAKDEVTFEAQGLNEVYGLGSMPLPPYIKRAPEELDMVYYQTVYARENGSIASPTAGLHFTESLLGEIGSRGIIICYVTLHINYSTFRPVKSEDITEHKMEPEYFRIPEELPPLIAKKNKGSERVIAVGTTSLRALEASSSGVKEGYTDLFIYPGYKFKSADCLLTNFHLPRTTLFMLTCAFAGEKLLMKAYQEAVERKYRFYSYGDAMLII